MSHTQPPAKPPRGCLKDRLRNNTRDASLEKPIQFIAHKVLSKMVDFFRAAINEKPEKYFCGNDAVEILLKYFEHAKEDFLGKELTKRNAILVLERFFSWKIIGSTTVTSNFVDCAKNIYFLLPEDEFVYARKKASDDSQLQRTPSNSPSRIKRDSSFKRFFKNGFSIGSSAPKQLVFEDDNRISTMHNATVSSDAKVTAEDATMYKAALQSILVLLDVSDLEGIANPEMADGASDSHISFLTSIFSRVGISSARSHRMPSDDEKTDDALTRNEFALRILKFFSVARALVPSIQLTPTTACCCPKEECSIWADKCLNHICAWLSDLTHNGATPIIPAEFANICSAIVDQVFLCDRAWHNENRVLQCLILMIPLAMRKHLRLLLQWVSESRCTGEITFGLAPSKFQYEPASSLCENTQRIILRIVDLLIPKSIGRHRQQILVQALVELFEAGHFDEVPLDIQAVVQNQRPGEELTVMTFRNRQKEDIDGDDFTRNELVKMIKMLLKSKALTAAEKSARLEAFRKEYPDLYIRHFSNVSFKTTANTPERTRKRFNKIF